MKTRLSNSRLVPLARIAAANLIGAVALSISIVAVAQGQDSTASRGFWAKLPFAGFHLDWGGGFVPYLDRRRHGGFASDGKLSFPLRRSPEWSVAVTTSSIFLPDTTSYSVPEPFGTTTYAYHPPLMTMTAAFEVQRRWDEWRRIHPVATVDVGALFNSYDYIETLHGTQSRRSDELTHIGFAEIACGGEVNMGRSLRATFMMGYRSGGRMKIRDAAGSNGGATIMLNLELGRFGARTTPR